LRLTTELTRRPGTASDIIAGMNHERNATGRSG
jgi:hypothetical protein